MSRRNHWAALVSTLLLFGQVDAQCDLQVEHLSGTQLVGSTSVTVTPDGLADSFSAYCASTLPYYIGYDQGIGGGDGSYFFHFVPAVSSVELKISAITNNVGSATEEVWLFVNGAHYVIPAPGTSNGCDDLAVITVNGDIGSLVPGAGWNMTIPGPITDLEVRNVMFIGDAAGSIFSLFICEGQGGANPEFQGDSVGCAPFTYSPLLNDPQPGVTYAWDFGEPGTQDTSSAQSPDHTFLNTGTYEVTLTATDTTSNESTTSTAEVIVLAEPVADLGPDTTICGGPVDMVLSAPNVGTTWLWSSGATTADITVNGAGTYSVQVSNGECSARDTVEVDLITGPDLGNDTAFCIGGSITLLGGAGDGWLWSTGGTTNSISVQNTGNYWLERTNTPCVFRDTISVVVHTLPIVDLGADTILCEQEPYILDATVPGATYSWNTGSTAATLSVTTTGLYAVEATLNGCGGGDSVRVDFADASPLGDLPLSLCGSTHLTLDAGNMGGRYIWSTGDTTRTVDVFTGGTYAVEIALGPCTIHDSVVVEGNELTLFAPNTFTPDGDGINDRFRPIGEHIGNLSLLVFDRWGELVYTSNDPSVSWDGTFNGSAVPTGVYAYSIEYRNICSGTGRIRQFGHVLVLR